MKKSVILLFNIILAACTSTALTSAPASITVTFENGTCIYSGPQPIPSGTDVTMNWVVKDTNLPIYSLSAFYLESGKTLDDAR